MKPHSTREGFLPSSKSVGQSVPLPRWRAGSLIVCIASSGCGAAAVRACGLILLVSALGFMLDPLVSSDDYLMSWCWCLICGVAIILVFPAALSDFRAWLSEPLVTLVLAFGVYHVLGCLCLLWFVDDELIGPAVEIRGITPSGQFRACCASGIGLGLAALGYRLVPIRPLRETLQRAIVCASVVPASACAPAFLLLGIGAQVVQWGWIPIADTATVGQMWAFLTNIGLVGIFLAAWRPSGWVGLALSSILVVWLSVSGLLSLSKQGFAKPLVAALGGFGMRKSGVMRGLGLMSVAPLAVWAVSSSVGEARSAGYVLPQSVGELAANVDALRASGQASGASALLRLNYSSTQEAVMRLYDQGARGRDLELIPWLIVPRFLVPSKPMMTRGGPEIYELTTGQQGSSDSPGVFVDGYLQGGWLGLAAFAFVTGGVLGQFGVLAGPVVRQHAAVLMPAVLIGHFMAFRIDGHFVPDVLGSSVLLWVMVAAVLLLLPARFGRYAASAKGRRGWRGKGTLPILSAGIDQAAEVQDRQGGVVS